MNESRHIPCLKSIDITLQSARAAGYLVDRDFIAFVWKIALGEATASEIGHWKDLLPQPAQDSEALHNPSMGILVQSQSILATIRSIEEKLDSFRYAGVS